MSALAKRTAVKFFSALSDYILTILYLYRPQPQRYCFLFNFNVAYNSFRNVLSSDISMYEASAVGNTGDHQNYHYKFFLYKTSLDVDMASPPPMDHPGLLVETLVGMLLGMLSTLLIQVMTIIWFQELEVNFC